MPVYQIARFAVRADARGAVERAMHEVASYVRRELPDVMWTAYRDPTTPTRYVVMTRADSPGAADRQRTASGIQAFDAALAPLLVGEVELTECELVTSSDLQRRHRGR
jgi:quinol monooxygenase YgiN